MNNDFLNYAVSAGLNSMHVENIMCANAAVAAGASTARSSSYISPTILEERKLNVSQMDVFSRLMMDRIIFLGTEVNDYTANVIQAQLLYLDSCDPEKPIQLYLNSPGGSVSAGLGIYDTMQYVRAKVGTTCTGMAASMGAILLAAGEKGMRTALPHSRIMIHQPMGGVQGQASDIEITAREILRLKDELNKILSDCTGKPIATIRNDADRDYWMAAKDALKYGIIDNVLIRK